MLVDASSSLNVSIYFYTTEQEYTLIILSKEQISQEVIKITSNAESVFFIRTAYLKLVKSEEIIENAEFLDAKENDILNAVFSFAAESKALEYLSRAEYSRFLLTKKLIEKKYEKQFIENALDYLEYKNYLSDERFCHAWLNSRKINHSEGRIKLSAELSVRGIDRKLSEKVLNEYFKENSEYELCKKDAKKAQKNLVDPQKIIRKLISHGFSYSMIKKVLSEAL